MKYIQFSMLITSAILALDGVYFAMLPLGWPWYLMLPVVLILLACIGFVVVLAFHIVGINVSGFLENIFAKKSRGK